MQNTKDTYHKATFKTKNLMKTDYKELVKFCDELLISDFQMNKKINDLKKENLKLIQAVYILNKANKDKDEKYSKLELEIENLRFTLRHCDECATDCVKNSMNLASNGNMYCDYCWDEHPNLAHTQLEI